MTSVIYEKDQHNIVHLILDKPNASANLMDNEFTESLATAVEKLRQDDYAGVIFRSNKSTFFAGGNLDDLFTTQKENADILYSMVNRLKLAMREIETQGKPVVACINGAALGGGWELALSAHYRIAMSKNVILGLPEVTLGLLPGGGGVIRMTRLLGVQAAMPYLLEGKQFKPEKGLELGLINEIVESPDAMLDAAITWIKANLSATQPYDVKGYKVPGGLPTQPALAKMLPIAPAMIRAKTKGTLPAPESILAVMIEGLQVDIDTAMRIESRYFVELVCSQVAKNMINTFWYQLNEIKAGAARPKEVGRKKVERKKVKKIGVLGAGMMGAGIAYSSAAKGINVVLKDVNLAAAEKGKAYSENIVNKKVKQQRLSRDKADGLLNAILPTENANDLADCELVIEAVFEDRDLKAKVTQETEAQLSASAVFASNTSTLPITGLAQASQRPENFIGLHFFSPVDKMPLVEIICGEKTSDETLALAYDYVQQIGKTPIVVNDSRGFYTSRVFGTFANEGIAMLGEGISAAAIENAAYLSGFPVGPLAVTDEVSLTLVDKIRKQTKLDLEAEGKEYHYHPSEAVVDNMLSLKRAGKLAGAGFYSYADNELANGSKKQLWSGLKDTFEQADKIIDLDELKDRLLYIQAIETVRCLEEKVLTSVRDANIGSIMGIGYPVWTGGILQFINQTGLEAFIERAEYLHENFGERFKVPDLLKEMAKDSLVFKDR
jgi:3-hydroxyacyl-CoA dehydrogenase/enoyl-CoA hydratase/3-hydroxybutyryl-CoA epimerase